MACKILQGPARYAGYMINRKNYSFWLPHLIREAGLSNVSVGSLGSAFQACGAVAKVALAVFVDTHSPTRVLVSAPLIVWLDRTGLSCCPSAHHMRGLT
jgi:sugar phosphate permease